MQLTEKDILKIPILSISKWSKKYGDGIANAAVNYLMENDKIDYVLLGRFRYVVLTKKTKEYKPMKSTQRDIKKKEALKLKRKENVKKG